MRTDAFLTYSPALGQELEMRRYSGDDGVAGAGVAGAGVAGAGVAGDGVAGAGAAQPLLAFPSMNGRVWDWENFGMVDSIRHLIDAGRVTLYVADSIDSQSWTAEGVAPAQRALRHTDFDRYLVDELLPLMRAETGRDTIWATGCSMGAFHSTSLLFRHPELVDGLIAMSGVYQLRRFIGEYSDPEVVAASPLDYLPGVTDPARLALYRRARIVLCVGQGAWEDDMLADTRAMEAVLASRDIPALVDYWGHDVNHDWPWWQKMLAYHLERLLS